MGYYFIYRLQLSQIKKEIKTEMLAQIPDSSLEVVVLEEHIDAIQWKDDDKEFSLNDEMYDVVSVKKVNGKTLLYCINDKNEKQLLVNFIKGMKADASNGKSGKSNIKFQYTDFTVISLEKNNSNIIYVNHKFSGYNSVLCTTIKEINAPPPRA